MDKLAQERSILNKLREQSNLTGKILESVNPEFSKMMNNLRATDERVRGNAGQLKDFVKSAKSLINRRDYLSGASAIAAFHERCRIIAADLARFEKSVDLKHYQFLLDQFDDEQKEQLFGYDPKKEPTLEADDGNSFSALEAQAAFWFNSTDPLADVANSLSKDRMTAMRALEKRFSISFLKTLKNDSITMFAETQKMFQFLVAVFKKLATALAKRNVDSYIAFSKKFEDRFKQYHEKFVSYYEKNITPLKEQNNKLLEQKRLMEEQKSKQMEDAAAGPREQSARQQQWDQSGMQGKLEQSFNQPQTDVKPWEQIRQKPNFPNKQEQESTLNKLPGEPEEQNVPISLINKKQPILAFLNKITKSASKNNPKSLVSEILAFADELDDSDPIASLKLVAIAEGIIEDYKSAGVFDFFKDKGEKPANDTSPMPTIPGPANDTAPEVKSPLV